MDILCIDGWPTQKEDPFAVKTLGEQKKAKTRESVLTTNMLLITLMPVVALTIVGLIIHFLRRNARQELQERQGQGFDIDYEGNIVEKEENENKANDDS